MNSTRHCDRIAQSQPGRGDKFLLSQCSCELERRAIMRYDCEETSQRKHTTEKDNMEYVGDDDMYGDDQNAEYGFCVCLHAGLCLLVCALLFSLLPLWFGRFANYSSHNVLMFFFFFGESAESSKPHSFCPDQETESGGGQITHFHLSILPSFAYLYTHIHIPATYPPIPWERETSRWLDGLATP